jgi:hypothetical protein
VRTVLRTPPLGIWKADAYRKRDRLKERRDREAEKIRMEQLAAKMSAKKLQRMKKVSCHVLPVH